MFNKLIKWFNGRHTLFAVFFAVSGTIMAWYHRLGPEYVALVTALQGYVILHSTKEDYFQNKSGGNQNQ